MRTNRIDREMAQHFQERDGENFSREGADHCVGDYDVEVCNVVSGLESGDCGLRICWRRTAEGEEDES